MNVAQEKEAAHIREQPPDAAKSVIAEVDLSLQGYSLM